MRPLRSAKQLRDDADVLLGHVDRQPLDRLVQRAVDLARHDLRLADGQLEALAAHELDEDRQLQLAAALDLPCVGPALPLGVQHAQGDVADELGVEAALEQPGGQLAAVLAGERRGVDADRDRQRRLVDGDDRQRARVVGVGQRLADRDVRDAGHGDDLARPGLARRSRGPAPRSRTARRSSLARSCRRRGTRRRPGPRRIVPWRTRQIARRPR